MFWVGRVSPEAIAAGKADAGLGLRATADRLGKSGVQELWDAAEALGEHLATTPGYDQA